MFHTYAIIKVDWVIQLPLTEGATMSHQYNSVIIISMHPPKEKWEDTPKVGKQYETNTTQKWLYVSKPSNSALLISWLSFQVI